MHEIGSEEGWVDVGRADAHLCVIKESVYRWIDEKGFPARRVGRLFRFKLSEVDACVVTGGGDDDGKRRAKKT
jgi:excisionase family DNA binding protein